MRPKNMLKVCLVFWEYEPQYAYKRYAYKKNLYTVSVQVAVQIMLKKAVKENEDFMGQISHKEDFLLRAHGSRKRRGAACEENVLERDGLLELLKTYMKLMHLRAYSLIRL